MRSYAVLTASGSDRVGIVDQFSQALLERSCNIEESRMAGLGGEFAIIVLVSGPAEAIGQLLAAVPAIGAGMGLQIVAKETTPRPPVPEGRPYVIECVSLDTPGIVHAVTHCLRRREVSIDDLETETSGAPFTGAPMFRMRITAIVPKGVQIRALREELDSVAAEHDLDITIRPALAGEES